MVQGAALVSLTPAAPGADGVVERAELAGVDWVFDRSYSPGSVKIVLAAGKVTSTMPWTSPAA